MDVELPVGPQLRGWHAGTATNTVPGAAAITLTGVDESTVRQAFCQSGNIAPDIAERLHINATAQGVTIEATGVAGHACQPSGTVNAIADKTLIWHGLGYRLRECGKRTDYRQWWFDYTGE